ncbi:MAG: SEFIR domain-containing protein [Pyrinomonadaceae bacterium]
MPSETAENKTEPIEVFISYSWTSDEYIDWVRELAEELMQNGIFVHLDEWTLKEGDDKYVYMENMVTNPKIKKVIILCDKRYQEKADDREGGVGTESTIIAPKIYEDVKEKAGKQKFIPVITRRYDAEGNDNPDGKEYMPAFIAGRKYVDFSNENHRADNMEQLIRTIYEKPLRVPPPLGKTPSYILDDNRTNLGTSARFTRAMDLVRNEKPQALGAVKEYFSTLSENMKAFDLKNPSIVSTDIIVDRIQERVCLDEYKYGQLQNFCRRIQRLPRYRFEC